MMQHACRNPQIHHMLDSELSFCSLPPQKLFTAVKYFAIPTFITAYEAITPLKKPEPRALGVWCPPATTLSELGRLHA